MVHASTRTRPSRSDSQPKAKPPTTAPNSVAITSEAPCACENPRSAEIGRSVKTEDEQVEAVGGIADRRSQNRIAVGAPGVAFDRSVVGAGCKRGLADVHWIPRSVAGPSEANWFCQMQ